MPSTKKRRRAKRHAERLVEEAIEAAASDQLHLAEKLIERALGAGPANARFWVESARIALLRGEPRRAERGVRRALELSPGYREAQELLQEIAPAAPVEPQPAEPPPIDEEIVFTARTARFDWEAIAEELAARGLARVPALLASAECVALRALHPQDDRFEHDVRIDDERGRVEYRFFTRPLPALVVDVRREVYARLAPIVNRWNELVGDARRWPSTHAAFEREYRAAGHLRTSPILLRYPPGGFNGFHRDVYGSIFFPLQMAVSLGPATIGDGGDFALVDDRPGRRRRVRALATDVGDAVIFCTRDRLCRIAGLTARQAVMHGVLEVRVERYAAGIPFHDYHDPERDPGRPR
jgi:hypothetical protein